MTDRKKIPAFTLERLCALYGELGRMMEENTARTDSGELGARLGQAAHTIRKDLSLLGAATEGSGRAGYDVAMLREHLKVSLGLGQRPLACIAGLGRLGTALLGYRNFLDCDLVAGFDSSHNRIELLDTDIALFPASRMEQIIRDKEITVGIVTVPAQSAQAVADSMVKAGIKGILNFAPVTLNVPEGTEKIKIDFSNALRILTARISQNNKT